MKIKFEPYGFCDQIKITKPCGEIEVSEGVGILQYISSNFRYGEITEIFLSGFGVIVTDRDLFEIKQSTGAEVIIDEDDES